MQRADLELLGLDHPLVQAELNRWQSLSPGQIGISIESEAGPGVLTIWFVESRGPAGEQRSSVIALGVAEDGRRELRLEQLATDIVQASGARSIFPLQDRQTLLRESIMPMLERELHHRQLVPPGGSYAAKRIGWVEVAGSR
ncbi:MAG: hypothetical protein GEEBNDBF_02700 [bacterium]|nr:hypothetical protein [bacterium]